MSFFFHRRAAHGGQIIRQQWEKVTRIAISVLNGDRGVVGLGSVTRDGDSREARATARASITVLMRCVRDPPLVSLPPDHVQHAKSNSDKRPVLLAHPPSPGVTPLTALESRTLGVSTHGGIGDNDQDNFSVDASSCFGYLHVELWDVDRPGADDADQSVPDPMLMVQRNSIPSASYSRNDNEWSWSVDTYVDLEGYRLLRAYHRVVVDLRSCASSCAGACSGDDAANCDALCLVDCKEPTRNEPFIVGVKNVRDWVQEELKFEVRATCVVYNATDVDNDTPPCPRPLGADAGECGGRGTCGDPSGFTSGTVDRVSYASGVCTCNDGWGDSGCDQALTQLVPGVETTVAIPVGEWRYFYLDVLDATHGSDPNVAILVEMERTAGDPVLFVKRVDGQDVADEAASTATSSNDASPTASGGSVPWVGDYAAFADSDGFRMRVNYHYISLTSAQVGRYYVAVFNNDVYLRDGAEVTLSAKTAFAAGGNALADDPLCPMACGGNDDPSRGSCLTASAATGVEVPSVGTTPVGVCRCQPGFAGDACEGAFTSIGVSSNTGGSGVSGTLKPGEWAYVRFEVDRGIADSGITIRFSHDGGGHPVLMLSQGEIPNLLDAHYVLSTTEYLDRRAQFKISSRDLSADLYFVAVFNMNYYRDGDSSYTISIESTFVDEYSVTSPGFMTVVLVVIMGMFICMVLSVCRRFVHRTMRRRTLRDVLMGREPPEDWGDFPMGQQRRDQRPVGCSRPVIDAIPKIEFGSEEWNARGRGDKEDEACSVCIDSFERGEVLCSLLTCQHAFHKDCIEGWLAQNTTCPNCRASLVPVEGDEGDEESGQRRPSWQNSNSTQTRTEASPPGAVDDAPTSADFIAIAADAREDAERGNGARRLGFSGRDGAPVVESNEQRPATLTPITSRR